MAANSAASSSKQIPTTNGSTKVSAPTKTSSSSSSKGKTSSSSSKYEVTSKKANTFGLEGKVSNSMRLFGVPHQFIATADPRIGVGTNLGRCFAERILMEAPIICLKPGKPDFLPGKSDSERAAFIQKMNKIIGGEYASLEDDSEDVMIYYQHKSCYSEMMSKVNILCKLMAGFLGINNTKVPWSKTNVSFGAYDWRYYSLKNQYGDVSYKAKNAKGIGQFIKDAASFAAETAMEDTEWIRFYVDSNASFSESNSNSTTTSIIESYTEKLEGVAKELDVISGIAGADLSSAMEASASSMDAFIQQHTSGDGPISTLLGRISGATKQILSGGNFLIPEIWSQSEYGKNYSFTITLSTPYGCPEAWFLNIGVPLCHLLGLSLPQQSSANTYKSPYLVKCYSPGWFNCNYGIIDNISIDKGADNSWSVGGLPNEIKVSLSVRDLYSTLSIPVQAHAQPKSFLSSGMLEFLMVNCGVDITNQSITDRLEIWATVIANNFTDSITAIPYDIQQFFKGKIQNLFNVIK